MDPKLDTAATPDPAGNDAAHARTVAAGFDSYVEEVADRRLQLTTKGVITATGRLSDTARASMDPDLADLVDLVFSGGTPDVAAEETVAEPTPDDAIPALAIDHGQVDLPPEKALEVLKDQYPTNSPEGNGPQPGPQGEGQ
jgi:hypothetical protein